MAIDKDEIIVDVWEVHPHYLAEFDYYMTDDPQEAIEAVKEIVEQFLDSAATGTDLDIKVKVRQMSRSEYE